MPALPTVGADVGLWGTELNNYLLVGHTSAGHHHAIFGVWEYGASLDDVSINAAVAAAAAAGGGIVQLEPNTYQTATSIVLTADNIILAGGGHGSIIKPASGAQFDVISTPIPASSGTGGYTRLNCAVRDLAIDCSQMFGTTAGKGNAFHFYGARRCRIEHVKVTGCPNWAFLLDGDGTNFGYNNWITGCFVDSTNGDVYTTYCEANYILFNEFNSAGAATTAAQPAFTPQDTSAYVIRAASGYNVIAENVIGTNLGAGGSQTTNQAIHLPNAGPTRIIGNRFDQVSYQCITVNGGNAVIAGNQFGSPSKVGSVAAIDLGSSNNVISGNQFDTTAGAAHYTYCINETGANSGNVIEGNRFTTGTSGVINQNASSNNKIAHNTGYNPVGQVTAPAFPATTVAATNNTGMDATAYIANGTGAITVVQVAGQAGAYVTTGYQIAASGWGSVRIPAGGGVKFTYSAGSPSWTWMGD